MQPAVHPGRKEERVTLRLIPILTSSAAGARTNNYQPAPAREEEALRILRKVQKDTPRVLTDWAYLDY